MRKCNCSGHCGPQYYDLSRRDFLGLVGAGAASLLATPAWGAFALPSDEWERWRRELFAPAFPRLYLSDKHTDARLHLGGIGTGNFEIGADGQFTTWQLFNTLQDGQVPFYFLAKSDAATRLLQTAGGPDWTRVKKIEMTGDYPVANLRFKDVGLPFDLELSAFTPFAPLDARFASMPLAVFVFRIHNPSPQPQTVSLAALMQNPVGYEAGAENSSLANACFAGNVNEVLHEGGMAGLLLRAEAGREPALDKPTAIYASKNLAALKIPPLDRPTSLTVEINEGQPIPVGKLQEPSRVVIWLEEPVASLSEEFLRSARDAVLAGATLVFAGKTMPLLEAYASWTGGKPLAEASPRPDIVFEDFEHGYENWKVEGEAFGTAPAQGTLPNQQPVSGFLGSGLVNSYLNGDATTGRLISKPFSIDRNFIRFLVGGGHFAKTQIRLVVDGKVARATSGKDNERLEPASWQVGEFAGKTGHIEIVDEEKGGWGHINVDQIVFSDLTGDRNVMVLLDQLLPARFSAVRPSDLPGGRSAVRLEGLALHPDSAQTTDSERGLELLIRSVGRGKVVLAAGPLLETAHAGLSHYRQRAYSFLCGLAGAKYVFSTGLHPRAPGFGSLALAALSERVSVLPAFDDLDQAWRQFAVDGRFAKLEQVQPKAPSAAGRTVFGAVAVEVEVAAGATVEAPFLLAWHYPNKYNGGDTWMGCHYATQWADARAVVRDAAANFPTLRQRTELFRQTFYDGTLPAWLLDCVTANAAIIRHVGVVFRIANGDVYGWEGSNGCCAPTCTHVWGYEQALARLFPELEKDMRRIDFKRQQRPDGGVNNRTDIPSPPRPSGEQPFADGHASCILKAYREALNHPNESLFEEYWPHILKAVEYLIARDAKSAGGEPGGVLRDDQWNTYDEALHGVTTFISGYYLAALRAGEEWARRVGDSASAARFHAIFEKGQKTLVELCWNGDYFQQDLPDYLDRQGEVGPGCMADQLIGQWWAHQLGLGYILPREKVIAALKAVFQHNFKSDLTGWAHSPRAFAGARDKGLIICTWPKGGRPAKVMLYSDEVWTGIEYQVAAHLIYEGLIEEGFAITKAARDRYDGIPRSPFPRNPWNEIECGGHYARAMSSWSLLLALSGFHYDGPRSALRFVPRIAPDRFRGPFTGPEGWGSLSQTRQGQTQRNELSLKEGRFPVSEITLGTPVAPKSVRVEHEGRLIEAAFRAVADGVVISFKPALMVEARQRLSIELS